MKEKKIVTNNKSSLDLELFGQVGWTLHFTKSSSAHPILIYTPRMY